MSYSNLETRLIGRQENGLPLEGGFPYLKFAWDVVLSGEGIGSSPPLVAKTCELPRWSTDTQIINVYNHKTIVQTKFNYEPITISFYDQCNKVADSVIWKFVHGQFDCTDGSKKANFEPIEVKITQKSLGGGPTTDKIYTLKNAFITDAQHDTLDYATSDVVLWTVTIRYENMESEFCDGQAQDVTTGVAVAKPTPPPVPTKPVNPAVVKPADKPVNGWVQNGGGSANDSDPTSAAYGIPRGRAGLHKLPGDVGYDPKVNPVKPGSLRSRLTQALPPNPRPPAPAPEPFAARLFSASSSTTPQFVNTVTIPLDSNTAQPSLYDASTGTVSPATDSTFPTRTEASKQSNFLSRLENMPDFKSSTTEWQTAFKNNFNPASDSPKDLQIAVKQAQLEANTSTQRYAPEVRVVDREVIYNTALNQQKEAIGPAVVNGYAPVNANDTKSNTLSSQQAARQQSYQANNPLKGNSTVW